MERANRSIAADPVAMQVLDGLYFPEPLEKIYEEVDAPPAVIRDVLLSLIDRGMVAVLRYDETRRDWLATSIFDKDDLSEYKFVITRKGLQLHNPVG